MDKKQPEIREIETWLTGYEGIYKITSSGHVFNRWGELRKTDTTKFGYQRIYLSKGNKVRGFLLHRLVAMEFIPNPENKPEVHHKDHDPANNHILNLEWVTALENTHYSIKAGRTKHCKRKELTKNQI